MVSIRERPASVDNRAVPGHWEGDLLSGSGKETQRFGPTGREHTLVCESTFGSVDLRDHAVLTNAVAQVVISGAAYWNIDKVPGRSLWPLQSDFVCPC